MELVKARASAFDFDSPLPVQGENFDAQKQEIWKALFHLAADQLLTINVLLGGAWLMEWWYHGGFRFMRIAFYKWAPGFLTMVEHGIL